MIKFRANSNFTNNEKFQMRSYRRWQKSQLSILYDILCKTIFHNCITDVIQI